MKLKDACSLEGKLWETQHIKKQRYHFADKDPYSQNYHFPSSHVWMWEFDHKVWALKNWCFWVVVLEKTLKSPWTAWRSKPSILKEINPEYSLEDCCWSSNTLAMWCEEPAYWKRSWCWDRLRAGEEDGDRGWDSCMASLTQWTWIWQTLGDNEGQGSLTSCSPWGLKELDTT